MYVSVSCARYLKRTQSMCICVLKTAYWGSCLNFSTIRDILVYKRPGQIADFPDIFIVDCVLATHGGTIMVREDGKRNFALREGQGDENSVFSGNTPRQAALKAARRLSPASSERSANKTELRLREKGTDKVHIYEGWAWEEDAPDNSPDWMPEEITEANVSKQGINHLEE
ncbi:MAG: non-histone chromosomal protein MC1 [Halorubrum sp. J07HR59]|nr:MAG: non-histone chromosomal protein MC1 [Halorubrum sp. J07HR59]